MIKMTQLLLAGAAALALSDVGLAQDTPPKPPGGAFADYVSPSDLGAAQDTPPTALPLPGAPAAGGGSGSVEAILRAPPHPRDVPASMFATSTPRTSAPMPIDAPYFVRDPLLDIPQFPAPGWFAGAQLQVVKPTLFNHLGQVGQYTQKGTRTSTSVQLPSAPLDWTVSPYLFLGYRLPSGFGDFAVAYRYLATVGSMGVRGAANGPAILSSRLAFNMIDLDYSSRELNFGHGWDMKPTLGLRILTLFFDSQSDQPFALSAAGNGTFQKRETNNLVGLGPHAALELSRHLGNSGWALWLRTDFTDAFDWINDGASTRSTTLGPAGRPLASQTYVFGHEDTPILNVQVGVTWKPTRYSGTRLFLGYQYEHFWALQAINTFSNGTTASLGQLTDQGVVMQATFNY